MVAITMLASHDKLWVIIIRVVAVVAVVATAATAASGGDRNPPLRSAHRSVQFGGVHTTVRTTNKTTGTIDDGRVACGLVILQCLGQNQERGVLAFVMVVD